MTAGQWRVSNGYVWFLRQDPLSGAGAGRSCLFFPHLPLPFLPLFLHPALGAWTRQWKLTLDLEAQNHTLWTAEQAWSPHTALRDLPSGFANKRKETLAVFKLLLSGVFHMQPNKSSFMSDTEKLDFFLVMRFCCDATYRATQEQDVSYRRERRLKPRAAQTPN